LQALSSTAATSGTSSFNAALHFTALKNSFGDVYAHCGAGNAAGDRAQIIFDAFYAVYNSVYK
jgi:hypothetical protein